MDFFARQEAARQSSRWLQYYFVIAVFTVIAAVNAVFFALAAYSGMATLGFRAWLYGPYAWKIALVTLGIIAGGSFVTSLRLSQGGPAVARMLGARGVAPNSQDPDERKLINVVEEMAIASGVPMPSIYLMEQEDGINAFAAGYKPTAAVVCVTRGALQKLSRAELQGVVGHEFSHILNGDMRINIRLISALAGIQTIGKIGEFLLRSSSHRSSSSRKNEGGFAALGLALLVIGYIGLFFGRLIKSAVSRQREFLADASAVQFTRDPSGIASALDKIGQESTGSALTNVNAEDVSHMCFGTVRARFNSWFATHPPIEERIRAIDPYRKYKTRTPEKSYAATEHSDDVDALISNLNQAPSASSETTPKQFVEQVGQLSPQHMSYGQAIHQAIPPALLEPIHDHQRTSLVMYALVLHDAAPDSMQIISGSLTDIDRASVSKYHNILSKLDKQHLLAVADLALPALKLLDSSQKRIFLANIDALIQADARISPFEFALRCLFKKQLSDEANRKDRVRFTTFSAVMPDLRTLLSTLAHASENGPAMEAAFNHAMQSFTQTLMPMVTRNECSLHRLTLALNRLSELSPLLKRPVIEACADCIAHDGKITLAEQALLRAVCECLDCPVPPQA